MFLKNNSLLVFFFSSDFHYSCIVVKYIINDTNISWEPFLPGHAPLPDHDKYKMENKLVDSGLFLENAEHGGAEGAGHVLHYSG